MIGNLTGAGLPYDGAPTGYEMALAMNSNALNMEDHAELTEAQKEELLNRSRDAKSQKERDRIMDSIGGSGIPLSLMDGNTVL